MKKLWMLKEGLVLMLLIVSVFIFHFSGVVYADTWAKAFGGGGYDNGYSIRQTGDGGYAVAGVTYSYGSSGKNAWVLKLDTNGNSRWQRAYGDCWANAIQQTADGGYVVAGYSSVGSQNAWVVKLDSNGDIQWQNTYGVSIYEGVVAYAIQQTQDSGYIVAGGDGGSKTLAMKLDANGAIVWKRTYYYSSYATAVTQTSDGGYIVSGSMMGGTLVIKLDADGNIQWQKTYSATNGSSTIPQTTDGGYVLTGPIYLGPGNTGVVAIKLDSQGNIQWQKAYGGEGNSYYSTTSIQQTKDGGYVVSGVTTSLGLSGEGWLLKLNASGDIQWQKGYGGGRSYGPIYSVQQTSDNGYIVTGTARGDDIGVLKLDANGNVSGCPSGQVVRDTYATAINTNVTATDITMTLVNTNIVQMPSSAIVTNTNAEPFTICMASEPHISVNPTSLNFDSVNMGSSSTRTITISNTGSSDLSIISMNITGTNASEYSQTNNCSTVAPNTSCTITATFAPTSLGAKNATLSVSSNDPDTLTVNVSLAGEGIDTTPPTTTVTLSGTLGNNDWYVSNVQVTLTATDNEGGSGVKKIAYSFDNSVWNIYSSPFTISNEGTTTVYYKSTDNANNVETAKSTSIKIDKTLPTITASASPLPNANGWNNTDVTVNFTCTDSISGIATCTSPVTVTTDGAGQVITGTAIDNAGNTATVSVTLNIDKTPPTVTTVTATPNTLWPPNHKMVDVKIDGSATDDTSGIASIEITVTDEYGIYNMIVPGFGSTIQLEAWREGTDKDGRVYTITVVVTDNAGNKSTATTQVIVPHDMGK